MAPTVPGFQGLKCCIQYLDILPHKPIFYHSNFYDKSNMIGLTWSGNKFEDYTTQYCLDLHQRADHAMLVLDIIHTILGVAVC